MSYYLRKISILLFLRLLFIFFKHCCVKSLSTNGGPNFLPSSNAFGVFIALCGCVDIVDIKSSQKTLNHQVHSIGIEICALHILVAVMVVPQIEKKASFLGGSFSWEVYFWMKKKLVFLIKVVQIEILICTFPKPYS